MVSDENIIRTHKKQNVDFFDQKHAFDLSNHSNTFKCIFFQSVIRVPNIFLESDAFILKLFVFFNKTMHLSILRFREMKIHLQNQTYSSEQKKGV